MKNLTNKPQDLFLTVKEAKPQDIGRGIIRIDPLVADHMDIRSGDVIQVIGKTGKKTAGKSWHGFPVDRGTGIIRLDPNLRRNAGVTIDDKVSIKKITSETKNASQILLAPTQPLRITGGEEYLRRILEGRVFTEGDFLELNVMGRIILFGVVSHQPPKAEAVIVTTETNFQISEKPLSEIPTSHVPKVSYEDIGGLREEIRKVREMIELPLKHPELFDRLGVEAPKGVLLHGPPGTGKTLLAKAVANESEANFYSIGGPEIMSKFYGESEAKLREIFDEAEKNAPSIIFIDEIDSIAPKRENVTGEVERRVVAQLLSLMDGMKSRGNVVVIGATNRVNDIDPALRRGGRFDREIEIGIPDKDGREEILTIHTRGMPLAEDVNLKHYADITHGFVGADLESLTKEAAMSSLRRLMPELDLNTPKFDMEVLNRITIKKSDFEAALLETHASALREVFIEVPNVSWDDIGGIKKAKEALIKAVEWPLKYPDIFAEMNANPPKGILLYGPPGTGKTMLAKAVAHEGGTNFISVKGPEFLSKWVGESEKAVRETFRKARQAAPCVIFFDEIESIVPRRGSDNTQVTERVVSQLLTEMDGLESLKGVMVIAATNRPDLIDPALLRPGRFDIKIEIGLPDLQDRIAILKVHLKGRPLDENIKLEDLANRLENRTGADIAALINEAATLAITRWVERRIIHPELPTTGWKITNEDIQGAMFKLEAEISPTEKKYPQRTVTEQEYY
ncbi:MAG: CDC48 family AAA ATPase [Candidatus Thorarchaeota archaeon]